MKSFGLGSYALSGGVCVALLAGCGGSRSPSPILPLSNSALPAATGSRTFSYTGAEQTFKVPSGVSQITVVARGGGGDAGYGGSDGAHPGTGGRVYAVLPVEPGEKLHIFVGGKGGTIDEPGLGGFNGGGDGGLDGYGDFGGAGGGASDLRQGGNGLHNRILVAAGGGGEGEFGPGLSGSEGSGASPGFGGKGGGTSGGGGGTGGGGIGSGVGGSGGTQSKGGVGGKGGTCGGCHPRGGDGAKGFLGNGGGGGRSGGYFGGGAGGGGGGGYYGGGGGGGAAWGGSSGTQPAGGGGGGGSSYVEPSAIKFQTWSGWKNATGNGLVVFSWQ